jgi:Tfp pilus assembly protein PilF
VFGRRRNRGPGNSDADARGGGQAALLIGMGLAQLQGGDRAQAMRWFEQASRADDPQILYDLGQIYTALGEQGRAGLCLRRAAQGGSVDALNALGVEAKNEGRLDEAERLLRRAAERGDANALNNLGNVLERRGDGPGAARYWRGAAEAGVTRAMLSLGMYLAAQGQPAQARAWYERAKAVAGPDESGLLQLLAAVIERGEQDQPGRATPGRATRAPEPPGPPAPAGPQGRPSDSPAAEGPPLVVDLGDLRRTVHRMRTAYLETGDPEILRLAIETGRLAVSALAPSDPGRVDALATLGSLQRLAFERDDDPRHLAEAIETGRAAIARPSSDPAYPGALSNLGNALQEQFRLDANPALLEEAAGLYQTAIDLVPPDHPELPGLLSNLGNARLTRAVHQGDQGLLDEAILAGRAALRANVPGNPSYPAHQANLANALLIRFAHSRNLGELNEAADLLRQALDTLPARHPGRPGIEERLAAARQLLEIVHAEPGWAQAEDQAGDQAEAQAAGLTLDAESRSLAETADRAAALIAMYERTGDLRRLHEAIGLLRPLLARDGLHPVIRHAVLHHLGTAHWSQFERTGDLTTLDEGAALLEAAAGVTQASETARLSSKANLSKLLTLRAQHSGQEADLQRCIELCREVLAATPQSDPWRAGRLAALASGLSQLGGRLGDSGLLREAVELDRAVLAAAPPDDPDRPASCSNLGLDLLTSYWVTHDPATLDEAVRLCREAVDASAPDHLLYPRFQANLGRALHARYRAGRAEDDLTEAAAAARSAVAGTPGGHPNLIERLSLLADVLDSRYLIHPEPAMLDELIRAADGAAAATTPGHRNWAATADLAARSLALRALQTGNPAELSTAMTRFREVATSDLAGTSERIVAAWRWAATQLAAGGVVAALEPLRLAVGLLPQAARRSLPRDDQERPLSLFAGRASSAAACALEAGDSELAVQLLEQGRGVLLGQALDTRGDLTALREQHPGLAAEFTRLRDLLDPGPLDPASRLTPAGPAEPPPLTAAGTGAQQRHAIAAQWDTLLADVRSRPGFERFLLAPTVAELRARCTAGPVVIVNLSEFRCDALILTADGLTVVPLPGVSLAEVTALAEKFRADLRSAFRPGPAADRIAATLGWLWDAIAAPVLDAAGLTAAPDSPAWPRIWWVPTGPLAFLPLHAAGYHGDAAGQNAGREARREAGSAPRAVLDRVISSYLPTVRSLPAPAPGEAGSGPEPATAPDVLVVAMPSTPSASDLPWARAEAEHIAERLPAAEVLTGSGATHAAVLAALPGHAWAHFACHAASSTVDAAAARLLLDDHEVHPLTVREIGRLRIPRAELAYLSACDTARGPVRLADEAVHVTGAFHMAGYTHVIGTLWSVADQIAAEVAGDVYASITAPAPDAAGTAAALHHAVRTVRDRHLGRAVLWAAHVHVGP